MKQREWRKIDNDIEFAEIFRGATITEVNASFPKDAAYIDSDLAWTLSDGRIVNMYIRDLGPGCDTCGYGGGSEKEYHVLDPR